MTLEPTQLFLLFSTYFAGIAVLLGLIIASAIFRIQLLEDRNHRAKERVYDFLDKTIGFAYTEWENVLRTISRSDDEESIFQAKYEDRKLIAAIDREGDSATLSEEDIRDVDEQQAGLERRRSEVDKLANRRAKVQRSIRANVVILGLSLLFVAPYLFLTSIQFDTVTNVALRWVIVGGGNVLALALLGPIFLAVVYLYQYVSL